MQEARSPDQRRADSRAVVADARRRMAPRKAESRRIVEKLKRIKAERKA